jgi:hypothetical protein
MKISISAAVLNHAAAKFSATALLIAAVGKDKGVLENTGSSEELSGMLPFFHNFKSEVSKICKVTKGEEEVTFEINDEYIKGSIDLSCNLYERLASPVFEAARQLKNWSAHVDSFNSEWEEQPETKEEPTTADKVIGIILEVQRAKAEHERVTGLKTDTLEVKAAEDKPSAPIYVGDLDRQVMISALVVTRAGEDIPYELSFLNVRSICQTTVDPLYYDAKQFDLPLEVLNAVRATYSIPPFFTKEQVAINVAEKEAADKLAREQAREKAKQEQEAAKVAEQTQQQDTNQPE